MCGETQGTVSEHICHHIWTLVVVALLSFNIFHLLTPSFCWSWCSQFRDLYVEDYFIDYLKDDVRIVKELPVELHALDPDAIEAVVSSAL